MNMSKIKRVWNWSPPTSVLGGLILMLWLSAVVWSQNSNFPPLGNTGTVGAGAVLGPIINLKVPSTLCPGCTAFGDTQQVQDAHMTVSGSILTSATANFKASDVGKTAFLVGPATDLDLTPNVTTITGFTNSTTITLAATETGNHCGGTNCFFTWGHDDSAAINAAITAGISNSIYFVNFLGQIPQIYAPAGGYMIGNYMNMQPASSSAYGASLIGDPGGTSTTFFTRPDITVNANSIAVLFGGNHNVMKDVIFNGSNAMYSSSGAEDYVAIQCADCTIEDVMVHWTGYTVGGTPGGALSVDVGGVGKNITVINSGVRQGSNSAFNNMKGCRAVGGNQTVWRGGVCSNFQTAANLSVEQVGPTDSNGLGGGAFFDGILTDECANVAGHGCLEVINSKNVRFSNMTSWGATGGAQYAMYVDGTSAVTLVGMNIGPYAGSTAGKGLIILSGGRVDATESIFRCFGTDSCINNAGTFNDIGGNHVAGNSSANYTGAGVFIPYPNVTYDATFPKVGATGTGACLTITTQTGTKLVGSLTCTGTTGAATIVLTPGTTATNGWNCGGAADVTTIADTLTQSAFTQTTCTLNSALVTSGDVITFKLSPF
jgi:hypothetical protein